MGTLKILDRELGDKRVTWDKGKVEEVELARAEFEFLTKEKKYLAYRPGKGGEPGEKLDEFDPLLEEVILRPQLAGG